MVGFIIGAVCVIALAKALRRHRRVHGGCGRGAMHWGHRGPGGHRGRVARVLDAVDATPEQQKVIRTQLGLFRKRARALRDEGERTRDDLAAVLSSDSFDENLMGEMFVRHDDVLRELRKDAVEALANIHEVLDERQRAKLARFLGTGRPFGFGPYRTAWA